VRKRIMVCTSLTLTLAAPFIALTGHLRSVRAYAAPTNDSSPSNGFPLPPGAMGELQQINHQIDAPTGS